MSAEYPIADKVNDTYNSMTQTWQASLQYCDDQMTTIKKRENYLKSIKVIQDQQDALQAIAGDIEVSEEALVSTEPAEVDLALAKHEDHRAALQVTCFVAIFVASSSAFEKLFGRQIVGKSAH